MQLQTSTNLCCSAIYNQQFGANKRFFCGFAHPITHRTFSPRWPPKWLIFFFCFAGQRVGSRCARCGASDHSSSARRSAQFLNRTSSVGLPIRHLVCVYSRHQQQAAPFAQHRAEALDHLRPKLPVELWPTSLAVALASWLSSPSTERSRFAEERVSSARPIKTKIEIQANSCQRFPTRNGQHPPSTVRFW